MLTGLDVGVDLTTPGKGEMRGHDIETQVRTWIDTGVLAWPAVPM